MTDQVTLEVRVAEAIVNQWREGGWEKATANERQDGILEARAALRVINDNRTQCSHPDCKTWRSSPCGEGCYWSPKDSTS